MFSTLTQSQGVSYNQNYSSTAIGDLHPPMTIDHIHALPPGTRFEEYRLDAVLGAGGFGITYRAYDAHLDKFVAIKEYLPGEFAARTEASTVAPKANTDAEDYHWGLTRFLDEARTLAGFNHPHLNRVHRFFESNGTAYMVLEYIQGETLADRLSREPYLEEAALQRLLDEVLSGLEVMHEAGYVHRDIKPGNLMLREEDGSAVVLEFGVGSRSYFTILTPGYAPMEQYTSKVDRVGAWTDIYALGMVAYRCISGMGDSELPDAPERMRVHTEGGTTLPPAVEAGKGRYNPKLLEAIDWAMEELIWDTHKLGTQYLILPPLFWFRKFLFIHRKRGKPALTFGIIPELSIVSLELPSETRQTGLDIRHYSRVEYCVPRTPELQNSRTPRTQYRDTVLHGIPGVCYPHPVIMLPRTGLPRP